MRVSPAHRAALAAAAVAIAAVGPSRAADRSRCEAAVIEAVSGEVAVIAPDGGRLRASPGLPLCPGDRIETGGAVDGAASSASPARLASGAPGAAFSRATLRFAAQGKLVRLGSDSSMTLPLEDRPAPVMLTRGLLYVVGTARRHFAVRTRYMTAGIDGTEAAVHHVDGTGSIVAVREGEVSTQGASGGAAALTVDEVAFAPPGGALRPVAAADAADLPPVFRSYVVRADAAVDWTVHYPAPLLLDPDDPAEREGAALIAAGRPDAAEAALGCASGPAAYDGRDAACAMLAVLLDRGAGEASPGIAAWARAAPPAGAASPEWLVARSYVAQAQGGLEEARGFALAALAFAPRDPWRAARVAEIDLLLGDAQEAERRLAPLVPGPPACGEAPALVHAVLGVARLSMARYDDGLADLDCAVAADPSEPLGWLGRGLGRFRKGDREAGTADIENAVALDPTGAASRIWLGRAYLELDRVKKAEAHLDLAAREDPDDPAPLLFRAIRRYDANDPVGALHDLEAAEARVGRRATLRSALGLSEDAAAIGAALGRTYGTLGFDEAAVEAGARAAETAPDSALAQGLLASALLSRPRSENARASARLRADLLSGPSAAPIQPALTERNLGLLDGPSAARATLAEFAPLFDSNGIRAYASGLVGTQSTFADELSAAILHDRVSLALGQFHYETDGYRDNNDVRHDILAAEAHARAGPELSLFGALRSRATKAGDRSLESRSGRQTPELRGSLSEVSGRLGAVWRPDRRTTALALVSASDIRRSVDLASGGLLLRPKDEMETLDLQGEVSRAWDRFALTAGAAAYRLEGDRVTLLPRAPLALAGPDIDGWFASAYLYLDAAPAEWIDLTLGLAAERDGAEEEFNGARQRLSPRAGLRVRPVPEVELRAAYLSGLQRNEFVAETLERATIAGFELRPDADRIAQFSRVGAGLDWRPAPGVLLGAEGLWSRYDLEAGEDAETRRASAYAALPFGQGFSGTAGISYEWGSSKRDAPRLDRTRTLMIPLGLRWFHDSGVFAGVDATWVDSSFRDVSAGARSSDSDRGVVLDALLGWRLPGRRGVITLELLNIADEEVGIQMEGERLVDVAAPAIAPSFTALLRFTASF